MKDILFFVFLNTVFFLIGFPFSKILSKRLFNFRYILSPTIGYGLLGIIIPILYKYGISVSNIFRILIVVACLIFLWLIVKIIKKTVSLKSQNVSSFFKPILTILIIWLIGSSFLIAPRLIGGNNFSVFQGNAWDTFGYLNSSVVYSKISYNEIVNSGKDEQIKNPLLSYAQVNLNARPSVHLLYSCMGQLFKTDYYKNYYVFMIFFFSQVILVFIFILVNFFKVNSFLFLGGISLAFPLGFWGQYILDINAWSQISSISILLLLVSFFIYSLINYENLFKEKSNIIRFFFFYVILFTSCFYLYPESLIFHCSILFIIFVFFAVNNLFIKKKNIYPIVKLILISFFSFFICVLISLLFYEGTLKFVLSQINFTGTTSVSWWKYFQRFILGCDGIINLSLLDNIIDFFAGVFGLYFLTPAINDGFFPSLISRVIIIVLILNISAILFLAIMKTFNISLKKNTYNSFLNRKLVITFFAILIIDIALSWCISIFINVKKGKISTPVNIYVNGLTNAEKKNIRFYRVSPSNKKYILLYNNEKWISRKGYFTAITLETDENIFLKDFVVQIKFGNSSSFINNNKSNWAKSEKNQYLLTLKDFKIQHKSIFNIFSGILNWPGDFYLVIKSFPILEIIETIMILMTLYFLIFFINFKLGLFEEQRSKISNKDAIIYYSSFVFISFLLITINVLGFKFWTAGKAFSFTSPYLILFILIPLFSLKIPGQYFIKITLFFFIISQISFGFLRIYCSTLPNGIHYNSPYPTYRSTNNYGINWNVDELKPYIQSSKMLGIDVKDRFLENYLMVFLYSNNKRFYSINEINTYFGVGDDLGYQDFKFNEKDFTLIQKNNHIYVNDLKTTNKININSTFCLEENQIFSADFGLGWYNILDNDKYKWAKQNESFLNIKNISDSDVIANLKFEFLIFNNNLVEIYLDNKKIAECVDNNCIINNLMMQPGEHILTFKSKLNPFEFDIISKQVCFALKYMMIERVE